LNVFIASLIVTAVLGLLGIILGRIVFNPVASSGVLAQIFTGIGLANILYGLIRFGFGARVGFYPTGFGARLDLGVVNITMGELIIIAVTIGSVAVLALFLTKSRLGGWIRASISNPDLARLRGVPVGRVSDAVWFIGFSLAGLAGVLVGLIGNVNPELGWEQTLIILAATVVGGLGSIYGVLLASLILGIAMDLSSLVIPSGYRLAVAFGALILVLLIRPQGLFAVARRREAI
jgi:neutral amino acid transport system permease protein